MRCSVRTLKIFIIRIFLIFTETQAFWGEYTNTYVGGLAIAGALMGLIALPQTFGSAFLYPEGYTYWNLEFLTTIGHQDCVAGIICIMMPVLLCAFVLLDGGLRYFCLPALFFLPYLAVFTDVDTAKMGFLALAALLPFLFQSRERLRRLLLGLSPILAGMAFAMAFSGWDAERHFAPGTKTVVLLLLAGAFCALSWWIGRREGEWKASPDKVRRMGYGIFAALALVGLVFSSPTAETTACCGRRRSCSTATCPMKRAPGGATSGRGPWPSLLRAPLWAVAPAAL